MQKIKSYVGRGPMQAGFGGIVPPEMQTDATINQAAPTSGWFYPLLAATDNVRVIGVAAACTWTVQPTPLEIHVVVDGDTYQFSQANPVSATYYGLIDFDLAAAITAQTLKAGLTTLGPFVLEGRSVTISVAVTGGTVSNLSARLRYATY